MHKMEARRKIGYNYTEGRKIVIEKSFVHEEGIIRSAYSLRMGLFRYYFDG